jgi:tetrahydromethanopterin S-methyltransferase subunit G
VGQDPRKTVSEIEQTREELAEKVDQLVGRARVEAGQLGKKIAIGGAVVAGLVLLAFIAKRRVRD